MTLGELLLQTPAPPFKVKRIAIARSVPNDLDIADCYIDSITEDEARLNATLLSHCATQLPKLVAVLEANLPDMDGTVDLSASFCCRWCSRRYAKIVARCTNPDCPGHQIRKALAEAQEVKEP